MGSKRVYEFRGGEIFRGDRLVGHYDTKLLDIIDLDSTLPKQMKKTIQKMIVNGLGTPTPAVHGAAPMVEDYSTHYPKEPPMDPKMGDKTPAYVMWYRRVHPDKFDEKYRGRKFALDYVPPVGDIPKLPMDEPEEGYLR
jgi:hypothetical protein